MIGKLIETNNLSLAANHNYRWLLVFSCLWLLAVAPVMAVEISVSVDRNPVQLNESFNLKYSAPESPDGEPDFSVLGDQFEILNQSQSSNISLINGSYSKQVTWTLSVMAKHAGKLIIPAVRFGDDASRPDSINVLASAPQESDQDEELFLQVSAKPNNPYVQSQVLYTVQFFRRVDITQATLGDPVLPRAVVEKLGEDSNFKTERNGVFYWVTQRQYAIFPQQSGITKIEPLVMTADVLTSRRRGFFSRQLTQSRRIVSKAIELQVRPVPSSFTGKHWLPAEELHLSEQWSKNPPSVDVGEPITRTVTLLAKGSQSSQLPELPPLSLDREAKDSIKQYPDQPVLRERKDSDGIISFREQKVALIPGQGGKFNVRGIEIPWWNTTTDQMEVARLPSAVIQGIPSGEFNLSQTPANLANPTPAPEKAHLDTESTTAIDEVVGVDFWKWLALFLAIAWGLTLFFWLASIHRKKRGPVQTEISESSNKLVRQLKQACRENDPVRAKDKLLAWAKLEWPDTPPANLAALASRCDTNLAEQVQRLSHSLYSRTGESWMGDECWRAFKAFAANKPTEKVSSNTGLEPLFRV